MEIQIRPAQTSDHPFILSLVPRFSEFELPPWRTRATLDATNRRTLSEALTSPDQQETVLIAEDSQGAALGFIHLQTNVDYFTGESYGYISDIAVAAAGEGRGVGRALIAAAERWASSAGLGLLMLHVFAGNERARRLYEQLGFAPDITRYAKQLG